MRLLRLPAAAAATPGRHAHGSHEPRRRVHRPRLEGQVDLAPRRAVVDRALKDHFRAGHRPVGADASHAAEQAVPRGAAEVRRARVQRRGQRRDGHGRDARERQGGRHRRRQKSERGGGGGEAGQRPRPPPGGQAPGRGRGLGGDAEPARCGRPEDADPRQPAHGVLREQQPRAEPGPRRQVGRCRGRGLERRHGQGAAARFGRQRGGHAPPPLVPEEAGRRAAAAPLRPRAGAVPARHAQREREDVEVRVVAGERDPDLQRRLREDAEPPQRRHRRHQQERERRLDDEVQACGQPSDRRRDEHVRVPREGRRQALGGEVVLEGRELGPRRALREDLDGARHEHELEENPPQAPEGGREAGWLFSGGAEEWWW